MQRVTIGVHVHAEPQRLGATLAAIAAHTATAHEILLLGDGPDAETAAALRRLTHLRQWSTADARGAPACFNRLAEQRADVVVLLESGATVGPRWLELLLAALTRPEIGLCGPSTNAAWNEQAAFAGAGGSLAEAARTAADAAARFGDAVRTLEPLHSLADFCYAVRRDVIDAVGAADESYGLGPCWEMDYNIRAARAGLRCAWVCGAYVHRAPLTARRQREEMRRFDASRKLYQDHFCGARLRGQKRDYRDHCRGDACPNFAPPSLIRTNRPFAVAERPPATASEPLVSCIMPTANRREFVRQAIRIFGRQSYERRELIIVDDGDDRVADLVPPNDDRIRYIACEGRRSLGSKRNIACAHARGTLIAHWDDDDWYPSDRLAAQVAALGSADIGGSSRLYFVEDAAGRAWEYRYGGAMPWVAGTTFLYTRAFWERHPFNDMTEGEDAEFFWRNESKRVCDLADPRLCVASIHRRNTAARDVSGPFWHPASADEIRRLMERDEQSGRPLVSCVMTTFNRRAFIPLALACFRRQTYEHRELVVVDDGEDRVGDLLRDAPDVRYVAVPKRLTVGAKRNLGCEHARGEIVALFDDDDWYGSRRIERQVAPILRGDADLTGLVDRFLLQLPQQKCWSLSGDLHRSMFAGDVAGGTLVFRRSIWSNGVVFPDISLGEDAAFLRDALRRGKRLLRLDDDGLFVYMRHGANTWSFEPGTFLIPAGWREGVLPAEFAREHLEQYAAAAGALARTP